MHSNHDVTFMADGLMPCKTICQTSLLTV